MTLLFCHSLSVIQQQEGPHSTMNEEEFFDALEMAYQEDETDSVSNKLVLLYFVHVSIISIALTTNSAF